MKAKGLMLVAVVANMANHRVRWWSRSEDLEAVMADCTRPAAKPSPRTIGKNDVLNEERRSRGRSPTEKGGGGEGGLVLSLACIPGTRTQPISKK